MLRWKEISLGQWYPFTLRISHGLVSRWLFKRDKLRVGRWAIDAKASKNDVYSWLAWFILEQIANLTSFSRHLLHRQHRIFSDIFLTVFYRHLCWQDPRFSNSWLVVVHLDLMIYGLNQCLMLGILELAEALESYKVPIEECRNGKIMSFMRRIANLYVVFIPKNGLFFTRSVLQCLTNY